MAHVPPRRTLIIHFLRHGQASHNINAEPMRAAGCSFQAFLDQMREDDEHDSKLTVAGRQQAEDVAATTHARAVCASADWLVASPHSRAVDTADLVLPGCAATTRVLREEWREISGLLINAQRMTRSGLQEKYGGGASEGDGGVGGEGDEGDEDSRLSERPRGATAAWDCGQLPTEEDELWEAEALEDQLHCASRAYDGLDWIWDATAAAGAATATREGGTAGEGAAEGEEAKEATAVKEVVVAAHGGIFHMMATLHPLIVADEGMRQRFHNCELRSCVVTAEEEEPAGKVVGDDGNDDALSLPAVFDAEAANRFPEDDEQREEHWEAWRAYLGGGVGGGAEGEGGAGAAGQSWLAGVRDRAARRPVRRFHLALLHDTAKV